MVGAVARERIVSAEVHRRAASCGAAEPRIRVRLPSFRVARRRRGSRRFGLAGRAAVDAEVQDAGKGRAADVGHAHATLGGVAVQDLAESPGLPASAEAWRAPSASRELQDVGDRETQLGGGSSGPSSGSGGGEWEEDGRKALFAESPSRPSAGRGTAAPCMGAKALVLASGSTGKSGLAGKFESGLRSIAGFNHSHEPASFTAIQIEDSQEANCVVFPGRFLSPTDYTGTSLAPSGARTLCGRGEAAGVPSAEEKRRRGAPAAVESRGGLGDPKNEPRLALTFIERDGEGLQRGEALCHGTDVGDESSMSPE